MNLTQKQKLLQKGWNDQDIQKAEAILHKEEYHYVFFAKIVFLSAVVVITISNIAISLVLIPFLVALQYWFLYLVVIILGAVVGSLYTFLVTNIGHLEQKHHQAASILVPIIALTNVVFIVLVSNQLITDIHAQTTQHSLFFVSLAFAGAFVLPYVVVQIVTRRRS